MTRTVATDIVIVGSGFAGLGMAIRLKRAGNERFVVLERAAEIGGTWRDNRYPGCACDIPAMLYSFSFAPKTDWSRTYPTQPEIFAYLRDCARRFRIESHVRLGTEVVEARYDEARAVWVVATKDGPTYLARVLVSAMGGLSNPYVPDIPGRDAFAGPQFHSATWRDVPLAGRDVAVVGTGASAIQLVPKIAPHVRTLSLFQRTPPWILPKPDLPVGPAARALRRFVPGYAWALRTFTYWTHEVRAIGFTVNPRLLAQTEKLARRHLERQVADSDLRAKLVPDYRMGCKRVLIANDYYPALARENVAVVDTPIARIERDAVVTSDGVRHHTDVIVYGTGFRAQEGMGSVRIVGAGGKTLDEAWRDGMEAFLGVNVAGFPNLFMLVGPNTGLGHSSMIFMIESQINYVLSALRFLRRRSVPALDVRPDVQRAFNVGLQRRMERTVWTSGCRSWYLDANGKNTALWPGFTFEFRRRTYRIDPLRYRLVRARKRAATVREV
jgi:cation diffusion facilitator CzcD-associated flavoprotein CzcO